MVTNINEHFSLPEFGLADKTAFYTPTTEISDKFMVEDLARSGLVAEDLDAYTNPLLLLTPGATGGYGIPYRYPTGELFRVKGELRMWRVRLNGGENKYSQPHKEHMEGFNFGSTPPYIHKNTIPLLAEHKTLYICEGEKKCASFIKHINRPAIGIGGCWNWGIKKKLHPWIAELVETHLIERIVVIPDGDVSKNWQVEVAYGTLAQELMQLSIPTEVIEIKDVNKGIDDYIVEWGIEAEAMFDSLEKLSALSLAEAPDKLAKRFGLAYRTARRDGKEVFKELFCNESNINILIEQHPAFHTEDFWYNRDNNRYMQGKKEIVWEIVEQRVGSYFQRNLGMPLVPVKKVAGSIVGQCLEHERSPFKERIKALHWDGVDRLDNWAIRLWGVKDTPSNREIMLKFWVGMAARVLHPGCKMDWMMVTYGGQGVGKTLFSNLASWGNEVPYIATGNAVDNMTKLHSGVIIVFDEMDALRKGEQTFWKTLLTNTKDILRRPYGKGEVTLSRASVCYGTTNHKEFLRKDATGQRRFGALEVTRMLDVEGFKAELDQLWAEAVAKVDSVLYRELSLETRRVTEEEHQSEDPMESKCLQFLTQEWAMDRFTMVDFLDYCGMKDQVRNASLTSPVKEIFEQLGCEYKKSMRVGTMNSRGYVIDRVKTPFVDRVEYKDSRY